MRYYQMTIEFEVPDIVIKEHLKVAVDGAIQDELSPQVHFISTIRESAQTRFERAKMREKK
jgi:hypothetical protein